MDWPSYFPDLNPIESLWHQLKDQICWRYPELEDLLKNREAKNLLVRAAIEVQEDFGLERFEKLIRPMKKRMQKVIDAQGQYTTY